MHDETEKILTLRRAYFLSWVALWIGALSLVGGVALGLQYLRWRYIEPWELK